MLKLLIVVAVGLIAPPYAGGESIVFKNYVLPCRRLPLNIRPTKYSMHLNFPSLQRNMLVWPQYDGQVNISVEFMRKTSEKRIEIIDDLKKIGCHFDGPPKQIVLHADTSLDIQEIKVYGEPLLKFLNSRRLMRLKISTLLRDRSNQLVAIKFKHGTFLRGRGVISISFKGTLNHNQRGVYVSVGASGHMHIVSQMRPDFARLVFPSFDDPRFRAPFSLSISYDRNMTAFGNTQVESHRNSGHMATTTFATTHKMPVHMLAFAIGQFDRPLNLHSKKFGRIRDVRIITEPGKRAAGKFALNMAKKSLEWFEQYINFEFPGSKLDIIAIPCLEKDNTESDGLVFVRDKILLVDDEKKPDAKIATAVNVAHVVVHQWFGNLISTCRWSDVWITEGVAAQFAFKFAKTQYPDSEYFVRLFILSSMLQADQSGKMHQLSPESWELETSEEAYGIFDNLEFMKSASLAQMLSDAVGEVNYQSLLRNLIYKYAHKVVCFSNYTKMLEWTLAANLLNPSYEPISILHTIPKFRGVPLLDVDNGENGLSLSLRSEGLTSTHKGLLSIFISLMNSTNSDRNLGHFISAYARMDNSYNLLWPLQNESSAFLKIDPNPTIRTYYRTRYTDRLYERLMLAVERKWIGPMDRLHLLDDANSLVKSKLIEKDVFSNFLNSYINEDHGAVLLGMLAANETLAQLGMAGSEAITQAIWRLYEKYGFMVTGNESLIMQRAREVILKTLVRQQNPLVINAAVHAYEQSQGQVALFLRDPIYTALVLSRSSHLGSLVDKFARIKSYDEGLRLIAAFTHSDDSKFVEQVCEAAKSAPEEVLIRYSDILQSKFGGCGKLKVFSSSE